MSTVLAPNPHQTDARANWRLAIGSHLALANGARRAASPVSLRSGSFDVDPDAGTGSLHVEFATPGGGILRGTAERSDRDAHGLALWTVHGTLSTEDRIVQVVLALRDHGVTRRSGTWWWLSGIGNERHCLRRPTRLGALVVADLLLVP